MRAWQREWAVPTTGAISQARDRLRDAPLKMLFERAAEPVAGAGTPGAWLGARRPSRGEHQSAGRSAHERAALPSRDPRRLPERASGPMRAGPLPCSADPGAVFLVE